MIENKTRNSYVDIMRGIAILLVVLGHTMTGCTLNSQNSFLFNVVWSLQMPLFILISGYVTRYSKKILSWSMFWLYIKRRTVAYLLPWVVWTFGVRGVLLGKVENFNLMNVFWNMDAGYWFLITIWTICLIYGFASFMANKRITHKTSCRNSAFKEIVYTGVFYAIGMVILVLVGLVLGFSFFCIKLTLYYMPFYYTGYVYGKFQNQINENEKGKWLTQIVIAVSLFVWLAIILRINLYAISDSGISILVRAFASLTGCIAICGLCSGLLGEKGGILSWCGVHSLEIYLTHYLLLSPLKLEIMKEANSIAGIVIIALNYILTVILTILVAQFLNVNCVLKQVLYGKIQ